MEQKNIQILKKEFRYGGEGYNLFKLMIFLYLLKKSNISYPLFKEDSNAQDYISKIYDLVDNNRENIYEVCGEELTDIFSFSILSFNKKVLLNSSVLLTLNEFTVEDIENFIVNEANFTGERDDYSTPKNLIELVIKLLNNNEEQSWFDLGCGNGDFLVEVTNTNKSIKCFGDETNIDCYLLAKARLYFARIEALIRFNDILKSEYNENVDVAYANTPFMMRLSKGESDYNKFNKFVGTLKPSQNADWIFADRLLQCIKDRGIILMTEASLMNINDIEQRKNVIEQNLIEGIIKLPTNVLTYTGISVLMVIFNKNKLNDEIKFLDATKMCNVGRRLSKLNVDEILEAYNTCNGVIKLNSDSISKEDYNLNIKKYLDVNDINLENETVLETVVEEIFRGVQIPASIIDEYSKVEAEEETYKLISVGDIQNGTFDVDTLQVIKNDGKFDRYLVKNGDVLVSSKSTKIKTAIVQIPDDQKFVATGSLLVIRCNQEMINPIYLKTFFDSNNGAKLLESIQTGTAIISINASALMKMRIPLINRTTQDKIAGKFLLKLEHFKEIKSKLSKLERELINVFNDSINN